MLKETNLTMPDESINILLFLANGFEDLEAIAIRDIFGRTQYRKNIKKAFVSATGFHPVIKSRFGLKVEPDSRNDELMDTVCKGTFLGRSI